MSWFDLILIVVFAALTALGAKRKLMGLIVGLGAALVFKPLLLVLQGNVYVALLLALVTGLILGLSSRFLLVRRIGTAGIYQFAGALGGAILATLVVLSVTTSLPLGRDINGLITYPSSSLPTGFGNAVRQSRLVNLGRDILLYPLLASEPRLSGKEGLYEPLHKFFVTGKPWEGSVN
ncbi:MAG: hypothetical protein KC422_04105 [Trueperaceae bacterium]|nr:hypothetical protein [Trueperaceae bacterium]